MKLSHKAALRYELIGILILLVTFIVQSYLETDVANLYTDERYYEIDEKLNVLWDATQQIHYDSNPTNDTLNYWGMATDWRSLDKHWNSINSHDFVEKQSDWVRYIRSFFYIIGTIMIAVGRYYDIRERENKSNTA